jgi:hypothetical protein
MQKLIQFCKPNQYQTICLSAPNVQMNYLPIEQAIAQLTNQKVTGDIKAKIIEPKPQP